MMRVECGVSLPEGEDELEVEDEDDDEGNDEPLQRIQDDVISHAVGRVQIQPSRYEAVRVVEEQGRVG